MMDEILKRGLQQVPALVIALVGVFLTVQFIVGRFLKHLEEQTKLSRKSYESIAEYNRESVESVARLNRDSTEKLERSISDSHKELADTNRALAAAINELRIEQAKRKGG